MCFRSGLLLPTRNTRQAQATEMTTRVGRGAGMTLARTTKLTIPDVNDNPAEDKLPLPLEIPMGHVLVSSVPATLPEALLKRLIVLRRGSGGLRGPSRDRLKRAPVTSTATESF